MHALLRRWTGSASFSRAAVRPVAATATATVAVAAALGAGLMCASDAKSATRYERELVTRPDRPQERVGRFVLDGENAMQRAVRIFGRPDRLKSQQAPQGPRGGCAARWSRLGLTISFGFGGYSPGAVDACQQRRQTIALEGTVSSPRWITRRGLRVGDRSSRIRTLYPNAVRRSSNVWWLLLARCPLCGYTREEGGTEKGPTLIATLRAGRVHSITVDALVRY